MLKSMKDLKNDLVIGEVKKEWLLVLFGSRWSLEVDRRMMSELDILDMYNDFCKEMRDEDMEYMIEEFGICNRFVDGMWSICMSDDESRLYIEVDKYEDLVKEIEDGDDNKVYELVSKIEEKYDLFV
tara:strand:+ start:206 stop:586 length:381 start_codon:yes stop_codon:yes gene_type:complete